MTSAGEIITDTTRWAVIYQRGKRPSEVWAVLEDVPLDVRLPEVREAIEQWSRWPAWQRRISSLGRVGFRPERRWTSTPPATAEVIAWSTLAPRERRISVLVSSEVWADVRDRAAAADVSLAEYVRGVLSNQVSQL